MDVKLLHEAYQQWTAYLAQHAEQQQEALSELGTSVAANDLRFYAATGDYTLFDQTYNRLPEETRFDEELIADIYRVFSERNMDEFAYEYLLEAENYLNIAKIAVLPGLQKLFDGAQNINLLKKYSVTLDRIRGILPENLAKITPDVINNKRNLDQFILNELLQALVIMNDKRDAIKQITHENRVTDYLQAILYFRLPIWGWSIQDQSRVGASPGGKTAGSADLILKTANKNIALIEALILRDKNYTHEHILKCPLYVNTLNRYYMLIYHLKPIADFANNWNTYKDDILSAAYPTDFQINANIGFVDLNNHFGDIPNFNIARTEHGKGLSVYHLMFNLTV